MMQYSVEPKIRKCVKGYGFLSLEENVKNYWIKHWMLKKNSQSR